MTHLLQINASIFSDGGQSSQLANRFVAGWRSRHPAATIAVRDLAAQPVPHLDSARFQAFLSRPENRSPEQQAVLDESDALIDEIKAADLIVLGLPMYNFGVPSMLKAYFDHIARAGVTFKYTENGPVGLLSGKKAYVFAARGGLYAGTSRDSQTPYVREFLKFIGIEDVEFIHAEGLNISADRKQSALTQAHAAIERLHTQLPLAA